MGGELDSPDDAPRPATVVDPFEHEQRFILTRTQAVAFYAAVGARASLELYDRDRPIAYTRTTYLDTDDFAYFRSCDGPVARRLRVREYASAVSVGDAPALSGISFLELKQNAGTTRTKIRLSAPPSFLRTLIERQNRPGGARDPFDFALPVRSAVDGGEPVAAMAALKNELHARRMAPRLSTLYRRACLSGEGGRVRITLDENLTFCRPQPVGGPGALAPPADVVASGPARVLEIKHWGEMPEWLSRAVEGLSPAPSFSKFRVGMLALKQQGSAPNLPESPADTAAPTLFLLTGHGS
jgi:hypothetical protein